METVADVSQLSAEELRDMLAKKELAEMEAKKAKAQEMITKLEAELTNAQNAVAIAKQARKDAVEAARKSAHEEATKAVDEAQERVNQIKAQIRESGGQSTAPTGPRTKSEGFGERDGKSTILAVLGEFDGPATPKQVCDRILADGLYIGKETSLTVAVSVALNKLAEEGEIKKEGFKRGCTFKIA